MSKDRKLLIRQASTQDAYVIALLGRITFTETFGHLFSDHNDLLNYFEQTFSVQKIERSLRKEHNIYWLALVDGLPVGYAKLKMRSPTPFLDDENVCQLQKIYVLKDFLSMKIGLALQNELLEEAGRSGSSFVWLSVLKDNERAVNFYLKNGFQKIGDHDFNIGKEDFDFMAMAKRLS